METHAQDAIFIVWAFIYFYGGWNSPKIILADPHQGPGLYLLGLLTFFTVGPKEARAWTVHKGAKAPDAAGEIHSDMQRGFIRAETIAYDDYVTLGGENPAKEAGKLRQEGKEYVVQDGDVLHFKFNV